MDENVSRFNDTAILNVDLYVTAADKKMDVLDRTTNCQEMFWFLRIDERLSIFENEQ
jgi:hypothetical protein